MKLYDISQEVFSCRVYPGDPKPEKKSLCVMEDGDLYNLTAFSMCAHNGTHIDAPFHFLKDGKSVEDIPLEVFVGSCYVARLEGTVSAKEAKAILQKSQGSRRILLAGPVTVLADGAKVFAESGVCLLGNESQTVGPENAPMEVHKILLSKEIVLLEGIVLKNVPEGRYVLHAVPLLLAGGDGAPCRAYLIEEG